jgi:hypothetical protein
MSKGSQDSRDLKVLQQNDYNLMVQYNELLCLRAELAKLHFLLKVSPPREYSITRRNRLAARPVKRDERRAS